MGPTEIKEKVYILKKGEKLMESKEKSIIIICTKNTILLTCEESWRAYIF